MEPRRAQAASAAALDGQGVEGPARAPAPAEQVKTGIEVRGLSKRFVSNRREPVLALDDVSLSVADGEFVSIVGPSGCGKSTLLYILAGFVGADEGEATLDGAAIDGPGTDRGIVFQEYALFPWRTVLQNVTYGLERARMGRRERLEAARRHIAQVGLQGFEDRYPKELSGGMKQRVAIARTLAYSPEVLLLDEPYGALDAQTREVMQDQLLEIWKERRRTVLLVTHDVAEAVFLSQRVVVMTSRPGRVKAVFDVDVDRDMPREEVMTSPRFNELRNALWLAVREEVRPADVVGGASGKGQAGG